jgi:hypothetical protein
MRKSLRQKLAEAITPIERPSPEPKDLEEGFQPSDFFIF